MRYRDIEERLFFNSVMDDSGCWLWLGKVGGRTKDYGLVSIWAPGRGPRNRRAHRVSYETFIGSIPDNMEIDHTCRNTMCIHPNHLEPVTRSENERRKRR